MCTQSRDLRRRSGCVAVTTAEARPHMGCGISFASAAFWLDEQGRTCASHGDHIVHTMSSVSYIKSASSRGKCMATTHMLRLHK
jgi:hypothetical protein